MLDRDDRSHRTRTEVSLLQDPNLASDHIQFPIFNFVPYWPQALNLRSSNSFEIQGRILREAHTLRSLYYVVTQQSHIPNQSKSLEKERKVSGEISPPDVIIIDTSPQPRGRGGIDQSISWPTRGWTNNGRAFSNMFRSGSIGKASSGRPEAEARPKWRWVRRASKAMRGAARENEKPIGSVSKNKTERTAQVREVFEQLRAGQKAACLSPLHRASARGEREMAKRW